MDEYTACQGPPAFVCTRSKVLQVSIRLPAPTNSTIGGLQSALFCALLLALPPEVYWPASLSLRSKSLTGGLSVDT